MRLPPSTRETTSLRTIRRIPRLRARQTKAARAHAHATPLASISATIRCTALELHPASSCTAQASVLAPLRTRLPNVHPLHPHSIPSRPWPRPAASKLAPESLYLGSELAGRRCSGRLHTLYSHPRSSPDTRPPCPRLGIELARRRRSGDNDPRGEAHVRARLSCAQGRASI
ncbi:hypothetical protein DFH09DRAFT_1146469 [Mycena vulgaris]|nr:hypothetical protein DFH09DRAFT_1146469 [Mycena vulgaris]